MQNKRKLSSFLINPDFQGKFIAIFVIFGFFQAFVNYYAIYFAFKQIRIGIEKSELPSDSTLLELVGLQEFYVISFIGIAFAISFLVFVVVGLRFTHGAAGALYRMKTELDAMKAQKALHHITLRKGDFFKDVESAFNEMVDEVGGQSSEKDN